MLDMPSPPPPPPGAGGGPRPGATQLADAAQRARQLVCGLVAWTPLWSSKVASNSIPAADAGLKPIFQWSGCQLQLRSELFELVRHGHQLGLPKASHHWQELVLQNVLQCWNNKHNNIQVFAASLLSSSDAPSAASPLMLLCVLRCSLSGNADSGGYRSHGSPGPIGCAAEEVPCQPQEPRSCVCAV